MTSENIHEVYSEGQEVEVRILDVNVEKNKMSLSMVPDKEDVGQCQVCFCFIHVLVSFATSLTDFLSCIFGREPLF